MRIRQNLVTIFLLLSAIFAACSDTPESEPEKGRIKTITDKVAKDIGNHIRQPIDKARAVKELQEDRLREEQAAADR